MNKVLYITWKISFLSWQSKTLYLDNYLLIFKGDSLLVHTLWQSTHIYSTKYEKLLYTDDSITVLSKKDWDLEISIDNIITQIDLSKLSHKKLEREVEETKKEYVLKKLSKLSMELISTEYQTNTGRIDILCTNLEKTKYYILELKNRNLTEKDINQCLRYIDDLSSILWTTNLEWYVIWLDYSEKVKAYSEQKWVRLLKYNQI